MQKSLVAILLLSLFEGILCYCARAVDPFTFSLEQILSDVTFEILPYPTYSNYPTCQTLQPVQTIQPFPLQPYVVEPCGYYPDPYYCPIELEMTIPPPPTCLDFPCGLDSFPGCGCGCGCYRDIRNPCIVCDNPSPLCLCYECDNPCGYGPFIYFPEVEYPMSCMDIKPYFYGNCWGI